MEMYDTVLHPPALDGLLLKAPNIYHGPKAHRMNKKLTCSHRMENNKNRTLGKGRNSVLLALSSLRYCNNTIFLVNLFYV